MIFSNSPNKPILLRIIPVDVSGDRNHGDRCSPLRMSVVGPPSAWPFHKRLKKNGGWSDDPMTTYPSSYCWWKKSCTSWGEGSLSHYFQVFFTSLVVVWDFSHQLVGAHPSSTWPSSLSTGDTMLSLFESIANGATWFHEILAIFCLEEIG